MPKGTCAVTEGSQHPRGPGFLKEKAGPAQEKPVLQGYLDHFLALGCTAEGGGTRDSAQPETAAREGSSTVPTLDHEAYRD